MKPGFGVFRHVERRQSNPTITERSSSAITETRTEYQVVVTRIVLLWITIWKHETHWS